MAEAKTYCHGHSRVAFGYHSDHLAAVAGSQFVEGGIEALVFCGVGRGSGIGIVLDQLRRVVSESYSGLMMSPLTGEWFVLDSGFPLLTTVTLSNAQLMPVPS